MDTEMIQQLKKKFSVGAIFSFITATVIIAFGAISATKGVITAIKLLSGILENFDDLTQGGRAALSVYLTKFVSEIGGIAGIICSFVPAIALIIVGITLLRKVNSKKTGILFALPVAASLFSILIYFIVVFVNFFIMLGTDISMARNVLMASILGSGVTLLSNFAIIVAWSAAAAVVLIFGGGREYTKKKAVAAVLLGLGVAALFAVSRLVVFLLGLAGNGMNLISYLNNVWIYNIPMDWQYLLNNFSTIIFSGVQNCVLGVLMTVTSFLTVKWLISPYKKPTEK